ncbi:unnamed protein product [Phytophthora fragariaefolia]|uniref:ATP-dependent DNA helicase n=1 Tax=Phytophthora fragariaefolia TaxID=1490495 RepID=A0A9W6Y0Q3_9STRA|nr:unnamed protein product [Phytophthora fragariaefolia]
MMVGRNPFPQQFLSFGQKLREDLARGMQVKDIRYVLHSKPSELRTYNLPTVSEVGVAMFEDGNLTRPRDLYVEAKDHSLLWLFEPDEKYDPQHPLLFPYGDLGWTYTDKVDNQAALHLGGRLFQQWDVDQDATCEQEQLRWVVKNQKKLRAELYHGISDALLNEETITLDEGEVLVSEYDRATGTLVHPDRGSRCEDYLNQVGKRIVLPDSHSGSPRNMYKHYQESMAIVREYGKPDAFITMTCNPKWVEIIVLLPDDQTAQDRPDIVARVWQLKIKAKLADLDEGLLGRLEARIYVVEFEKRDLPHAHIVIIVDEEDKPHTREIMDKLVSTEVPDKEVTPSSAATHSGFLENDQEWIACVSEASAFRMPIQLRQLFTTLLVYSQVSDVRGLWNRFYDELARDFAYKYRNLEGQNKDAMIMFHTLKSLNDLLQISGQDVAGFDQPQLSDYPTLVLDSILENNLIRRELEEYVHSVLQDVNDHMDEHNEGQRAIYDLVLGAVHNPQRGENLFFIGGPGGTGKSTLLKHILASERLSGKIAIAVPSGGIAALLLMGGRTAHSTFKIPLKLDEKSVCSIHNPSKLKKFFQEASLIIWDEAPMTHRHAFKAVDRSLRDVLNNDEDPFGGKTEVLSGDFRQILPVVVRGTPAETIDACQKSSDLWSHFRQVHLTTMLIDDPPEQEVDEEEVITPGASPSGLKRLIDVIYPDVNNQAIATDEYLATRTILTTTNVMVHRINDAVAARLDGGAHEYRSFDKLQDDDDWNFFEPEILNSVNINGIPPHKLTLKKGAPIMLMRNLNPDLGLCNRTQLQVMELKPNLIHANTMTVERRGQDVLIPRIVFISDGNDASFPYQLRRK